MDIKIKIPKKEECKNCIHFWTTTDSKAICTHPNMKNNKKNCTLFYVCDYFEASDITENDINIDNIL